MRAWLIGRMVEILNKGDRSDITERLLLSLARLSYLYASKVLPVEWLQA